MSESQPSERLENRAYAIHPFSLSAWDAYAIINDKQGFEIPDHVCIIINPWDSSWNPDQYFSRYGIPFIEVGEWMLWRVFSIPYGSHISNMLYDFYHQGEENDPVFHMDMQIFDMDIQRKLFVQWNEYITDAEGNRINRAGSLRNGFELLLLNRDFTRLSV